MSIDNVTKMRRGTGDTVTPVVSTDGTHKPRGHARSTSLTALPGPVRQAAGSNIRFVDMDIPLGKTTASLPMGFRSRSSTGIGVRSNRVNHAGVNTREDALCRTARTIARTQGDGKGKENQELVLFIADGAPTGLQGRSRMQGAENRSGACASPGEPLRHLLARGEKPGTWMKISAARPCACSPSQGLLARHGPSRDARRARAPPRWKPPVVWRRPFGAVALGGPTRAPAVALPQSTRGPWPSGRSSHTAALRTRFPRGGAPGKPVRTVALRGVTTLG